MSELAGSGPVKSITKGFVLYSFCGPVLVGRLLCCKLTRFWRCQLTELDMTIKQVNHTFVLCGFSLIIGAGSWMISAAVASSGSLGAASGASSGRIASAGS